MRRYFYLAIFALSLIGASFQIQSSWHKPVATIQAAAGFQLVSSNFCVTGMQGKSLVIDVTKGQLQPGSIGRLWQSSTNLSQGDCLSGILQLSPAQPLERFAFQARLKQVTGQIRQTENLGFVLAVRNFAGSLRGEPSNLVAGLAIGIDSGLSEQFRNNMKATGLTHLTAVSGANCAIVLGLVWLILRMFRLGRGVRTIITLVSLAGYVSLVGWQPSVLRSAFMMSTVYLSLELGRRVWLPAALAFGSLVLLAVDPWMAIEFGFWLSVLATYGLVLLTPRLVEKFEQNMPKWLAVGLAATISAQLWCLPILIYLQGGFTTHSVLANLLVEPMVPMMTVLGLLGFLAGPIFPWLGEVLVGVAALPAGWIVSVANSLANAPIGLLPIASDVVGITLCATFVISASVAIVKRKFGYTALSLAILCIWLGSLGNSAIRQVGFANGNWQVFACDVGQGDALVIRSQNSYALVDVGKDPELIDSCLDGIHVETIDLLVLTHFDHDHVGGLSGALLGRRVSRALISPFPDERPVASEITEQIGSTGAEVTAAANGLTGSLGEFTWEIISSLGIAGSSANEASLGMKFESKDLNIYTLADLNEVAQEKMQSEIFDSSKPTVVKVSHHGSADQSAELYRRIGADAALISVGKNNSYGHPTSRALKILGGAKTQVFRTDLSGSIVMGVSNGVIEVKSAGAR